MSATSLVATLFIAQGSLYAGIRTQKKVHHATTHSIAYAAAGLSNFSSALFYLNQQPADEACMPVCKWTCETSTCAQVCEPKCDAPKCESRCSMDTSSCAFNCQEPSCALVCPEAACAESKMDPCPKCHAVCGEPVCTLDCPGPQPCSTVCEEPQCSYDCKKPDSCPEPKCSLECDKPKACQDFQVAKELPPPRAGETTVVSFDTSDEILHAGQAPKLHKIPTSTCPPGCAAGGVALIAGLQLNSRSQAADAPRVSCPVGCLPVANSAPKPVNTPLMTAVKPVPTTVNFAAKSPAPAPSNSSAPTAEKKPAAAPAKDPAPTAEKKVAKTIEKKPADKQAAAKKPAPATVKNAAPNAMKKPSAASAKKQSKK